MRFDEFRVTKERPHIPNLPDFLRLGGGEVVNEDPQGYYPVFEDDKDVRPMLEAFLDSTGKRMPADDVLPEFLYSDEGTIRTAVADGTNVTQEWERWLASCPSK